MISHAAISMYLDAVCPLPHIPKQKKSLTTIVKDFSS